MKFIIKKQKGAVIARSVSDEAIQKKIPIYLSDLKTPYFPPLSVIPAKAGIHCKLME